MVHWIPAGAGLTTPNYRCAKAPESGDRQGLLVRVKRTTEPFGNQCVISSERLRGIDFPEIGRSAVDSDSSLSGRLVQ